MKFKLILLLLFLNAISLFSEENKPPMYFDALTINEGLSHNTVYCMMQDTYGYVWIGTQNGLNKYDGYNIKVIRTNEEDSKGFKGKIITALLEDSKGNIWVGTRKNGINIKNSNTGKFTNLNAIFKVIEGFEITSFLEDDEQNIWIATNGAGLVKYHPDNQNIIHFHTSNNNINNDIVFDIKQDKFGFVWIAEYTDGISYLDEDNTFKNTIVHPDFTGYRRKILVDDDYLWIGTERGGVFKVNLIKKEFEKEYLSTSSVGLSSNLVRGLYKNDKNELFIATDGEGLNIFNENNMKVNHYEYEPNQSFSINSNALFCFLEDKSGNIWIGTYNGGVNICKKNKTWFELIAANVDNLKSLDQRSILAIHETQNGDIWLGTDGGGVCWLDKENNVFSSKTFNHIPNQPNTISGNVVKTIYEDFDGNIWMGFFGAGLDKYNPKTKKIIHYGNENGLNGRNIWTIAQRKNGELWFGTLGDGINIFNPNTNEFKYIVHNPNDPQSIPANSIMVLLVDNNENVWIGTQDNGLCIWNEKLGFKYFNNENNNAHIGNEIRTIFEDSKGNIWIGTEDHGLSLWQSEDGFKNISKSQGLIANSVMGITEDSQGFIWVTTYDGISRVNPSNFNVMNFYFKSNQFNQMSILTSSSGRLLFGGIKGLNTIYGDNVIETQPQPDLILTDFKVFNKSIPVGKLKDGRTILDTNIERVQNIQLQYYDNSFSFRFAAIDFTYTNAFIYEYKMEGFDEEWQQTSKGQPSANYTNIDPGKYTFKVRLLDKQIAVNVIISPPFWTTPWFKLTTFLILAFAILGTAYLFFKRREATHQQKLLEAESQILQLTNEKLASEVNAKNSKLMFSSMQMAYKNQVLGDIKKDLEKNIIEPNRGLRAILRKLETELENKDYWEEFNIYLNEVDQDFVKSLVAQHPELTKNDIRISTLIRLQLNTKEIASLLNVSTRAVEKSRQRLKKRLNLYKNQDLDKYILNFNSKK